ncbi:hypothetical protein HBZS_104200 [Helicobacter bizzozeronii CCUG 35545]|nr:hypothetical protein HBZS_104200 [Helicobacter bizzozeronii CCUG 35545]
MHCNPQFLDNLHILNPQQKQELKALSLNFSNFATMQGCIEKLRFDFIYSSAQIEGNIYSWLAVGNGLYPTCLKQRLKHSKSRRARPILLFSLQREHGFLAKSGGVFLWRAL